MSRDSFEISQLKIRRVLKGNQPDSLCNDSLFINKRPRKAVNLIDFDRIFKIVKNIVFNLNSRKNLQIYLNTDNLFQQNLQASFLLCINIFSCCYPNITVTELKRFIFISCQIALCTKHVTHSNINQIYIRSRCYHDISTDG